MAERYCEVTDLYDFGLPRGSTRNQSRLVGDISVAANTFELESHGFPLNFPVSFRGEAGGSVPAPLEDGPTYYAVPVDDDHFSVALTSGGAVVDLTSAGSRVRVVFRLPVLEAIEYGSELVIDMLPAHVVPLVAPYPRIVSMTVAEIAAAKLGYCSGGVSKSLADMLDQAQKRLARWATGVPIRGVNAPQGASLSSVALPRSDVNGWSRYGGIG